MDPVLEWRVDGGKLNAPGFGIRSWQEEREEEGEQVNALIKRVQFAIFSWEGDLRRFKQQVYGAKSFHTVALCGRTRQGQSEQVSNSRNKIHQIGSAPVSESLYL